MTRDLGSLCFASTLKEVVEARGDRPAFRCGDVMLTYTELDALVEEKKGLYEAAGIHSSSTVGVIADEVAEFLADVFALLALQAFGVLLPADTTRWELARLSSQLRLSHLLSAARLDGRGDSIGRSRILTRFDSESMPVGEGARLGFLTSGTTGHSKVALRTGRAMLSEAMAMRHELGFTPGRRLGTLVPLHHSFGFGDCALSGILAGAEVVAFPRMHPSAYLAAFERAAIEVIALVPAQLRLLAEASGAPVFRHLAVLSAGAPLNARTARLAAERLGCTIGQVYGSTETGVIAVAAPGEGDASTVGKPSRHMEVRLDALSPEWESVAPAASPEGIVTVRSPALFDGYVTLNGLDRDSLRTGWFSTGDRARWVDGRLELLGRLSSAINVAGVKVSAEEVEAALLEFPAVRSALVTGVEDTLTHQRIKAYVTPADVDLNALRRFCEEHLSPSKRPHYYEAVAALATTPSGKVIRSSLAATASHGSTRPPERTPTN